MDKLRIADPDTFVWVKGRLALISPPPGDAAVCVLVDGTIWGLSQEAGLGQAVAKGMLTMMASAAADRLDRFIVLVRQATETGPTLGRIMATFLPQALMAGDGFLGHFQHTIATMQQKGTYTLNAPLEVMAQLLTQGDGDAAWAYLDLLKGTFSQQLTYNQSLRLVYLIPKAVAAFNHRRRSAQIGQLHRVAVTDLKLVDAFIDGLEKGTGLLDENALVEFVDQALASHALAPEAGLKFLSLSSKAGESACTALGRAVTLDQVSAKLNRYLYARIGRAVPVLPLSRLSKADKQIPWVCGDGRHIYLPDEIDANPSQSENLALYKTLCRWEAGFFECRTFDFDLEKAADQDADVARISEAANNLTSPAMPGDGQRFLNCFAPATLAADLFDIFEQARVNRHLWDHYPGLMRQVMPLMRTTFQECGGMDGKGLLTPVFSRLVLEQDMPDAPGAGSLDLQRQLVDMFNARIDANSSVETVAGLVCRAFTLISNKIGRQINRYRSMVFPFDRRLRWNVIEHALSIHEQTARQIKMRLKEMGLDVYTSDLRTRLEDQQGGLAAEDISELVLTRAGRGPTAQVALDLSHIDMAELLRKSGAEIQGRGNANGSAVSYPEWDLHLQDYLQDHTWVQEIAVPGDRDGVFYSEVLARHQGLVANMRRAFELLKPEGMAMLRQWPEGDAFDYRALVDYVMDRRAGRMPSDRLFIKRLKQERDVAVMLLVDLSRSTANPVSGGHTTVLGVAKEALVLFCEALEVVGDDYAIAGFSGTGRHSVDFYGIKALKEALTDTVRSRISSLKPQRSTRMGAAIRHGAALLAQAEARVRLMIVVSDGFPNDIGYKSDYAIADTRRSIQEVRSQNAHVKAITVNIGSDPRLDDLYGRNHHYVIGDVRELPDQLVRLYGALTRV